MLHLTVAVIFIFSHIYKKVFIMKGKKFSFILKKTTQKIKKLSLGKPA